MLKVTSLIILLVSFVHVSYGQTCCTAGAPIVSGIGIQSSSDYKLSISLLAESRSINRLVDNNRVLQNDPRSRSGINGLLGISYSVSDKLSLGLSVPMVYQNRTTISETQSSTGIGDINLIGQYKVWKNNNNSLYVISSVKIPTGVNNHLGERDIILSPDMQSGSGTVDFINQISFHSSRIWDTSYGIETGVLYRYNNTNNSFGSVNGSNGRAFKFGNELQWHVSLNRELLVKEIFIVPDLEFQYRFASPNQELDFNAPNSGGHWVNSAFGIYILPEEQFSFRPYIQLPLYQDLDGLQITTNIQWGVEIGYRIKFNSNKNLINDVIF